MRRIGLLILFPATVSSLCWAEEKLKFDIKANERITREEAESVVDGTSDLVVFHIRSKRGIGSATIRPRTRWPKKVELRLHLRGLENLELDNGTRVIASSYSIHHKNTYVSITGSPGRRDLKNKVKNSHPLFLKITPVSLKPERAPSIPLDGYFKVMIPGKFLKKQPRSLKVNWIDFYR